MTIKSVWINGVKVIVERNRYGVYELYLDYNDLIWLNKIHRNHQSRRRDKNVRKK